MKIKFYNGCMITNKQENNAVTLSQHPEHLIKKLQSFEGRLADFITYFAGSMYFVYFHVVWFAFWIVANDGWLKPW
jgi:uncharacterized membrane protein